jgi:predicted transcriptional regulator
MPKPTQSNLTRRERQVMDILYRLGNANAGEVMKELSGNPSDSTVRTLLRILEDKGHVKHEEEGLRYVYSPKVPRSAVRQSALKHLMDTFFDGSTEKVVAALIGAEGSRLSREELHRIARLVEKAEKEEGRR